VSSDIIGRAGKGIIISGLTLFLGVVGLAASSSLVERVDAGEIVVLQDPIDGELHVFSEPGLYGQWFGTVTRYQKSEQVWFTDENNLDTGPTTTRFNDGGKAWLSGSIRYDLPSDTDSMLSLHTKYRNHDAVHDALVVQTVGKSVYMSGPLMSSTESYAARRSELLDLVQDQLTNGTFKTTVREETTTDVLTGEETIVKITEIVYDDNGEAKRQENSPFEEFGITTRNLVITGIEYDEDVQAQIDKQRAMTMAVQTAKAQSLQAEQDAITAEKQGEADAARAKWKEEAVKATQVTVAEREKAVAQLDAEKSLEVQRLATESAKLFKEEQRLIGEGEAARKRAVMLADGALDKKLAAWVDVNKAYAAEIGKQQWVPDVQMGSTTSSGGSSATDLVDLFTVKTAKDLNLDMTAK